MGSADQGENLLPGKWRWLRARLLRIGGVLVVILLFSGEVALRLIYYEQLKTRTYPLIYQPDERVGYRYVPGIEGKICIPSICKEFSINQTGFTDRASSGGSNPAFFASRSSVRRRRRVSGSPPGKIFR